MDKPTRAVPMADATFAPPVMEARRWVEAARFPANRPLLNLSQAAPIDPPPESLRQVMAEAIVRDSSAHIYGPVLGLPALREEIAAQWSAAYGGEIAPADVGVTAGCNQAFCAAITAVAARGEAVMLPTPWYFNHKMWLDMLGIEAVLLPCGPDMLPSAEAAATLFTRPGSPRIAAIVLVTPNNPTGAEYPAELMTAFAKLARSQGAALIVDETYRDFHSQVGPPHDLFASPDWRETLVHLYSFSKVFRLTGHRVGAMIAAPSRLAMAEKFLDTVAICPPQIGQIAALAGLRTLADWVAAERREILDRRAAVTEGMAILPAWRLLGCGAYFAFLAHPFDDLPSDTLARRLVEETSILTLPGTMFGPRIEEGGDGTAERTLRVAFANADRAGIGEMVERLAGFAA
ncbi:MAG: aminotransferase [Pseudomonadota bacterium]